MHKRTAAAAVVVKTTETQLFVMVYARIYFHRFLLPSVAVLLLLLFTIFDTIFFYYLCCVHVCKMEMRAESRLQSHITHNNGQHQHQLNKNK